MKIALYGSSAFQFWRSANLSPNKTKSRLSMLDDFAPRLQHSESIYLENRYGITFPVEVLVGSASSRRNSRILRCHVPGDRSREKALVHVGKNFYVASPEWTLIQLAYQLSSMPRDARSRFFADEVILCTLMYELAGNYRIQPGSSDGFRKANPVLDLDELGAILPRVKGMRGVAKLRAALRYALGGSNSPAESQLSMFEVFPKIWGGEGLPKPELNQEIVTVQAGSVKKRFGDQCWKDAKRIVEYNGGYHEGERANDDDARRNALMAKGYSVYVINKEQLHDAAKLQEIIRDVGKHVGSAGYYTADFEARRSAMRSLVFEACNTKCAENTGMLVPRSVCARPYPL